MISMSDNNVIEKEMGRHNVAYDLRNHGIAYRLYIFSHIKPNFNSALTRIRCRPNMIVKWVHD